VSTYLIRIRKDDWNSSCCCALAKILGFIERLEPTGVCETKSRAVFVPTPPNSNATKDNLEFEWLLCLASAPHAIRRRWPTDIGETQGLEGIVGLRMESSLRENPEGMNFTRENGIRETANRPSLRPIDAVHGWNSVPEVMVCQLKHGNGGWPSLSFHGRMH